MIQVDALGARVAVDAGTEALARAASGGDDEAFAALVARYQRRLLGFAYQHLHDASEAQDLAQEVFVRLYRNLARYDSRRPFEPWFWALASRVALNYARARAPERLRDGPPADLAAPPTPGGEGSDAPAELEPQGRLPLLWHYYLGLSLDEVAGALEITVPALKSRMHRARAILRQALVEA